MPAGRRPLSSLELANPDYLSGAPKGRENTIGSGCNNDAIHAKSVSLFIQRTYVIHGAQVSLQFSDTPSDF